MNLNQTAKILNLLLSRALLFKPQIEPPFIMKSRRGKYKIKTEPHVLHRSYYVQYMLLKTCKDFFKLELKFTK